MIYNVSMEIKTKRLTLFTLNKKNFKTLRDLGVFKDKTVKAIVKDHLKRYKYEESLMEWSIWAVKLNETEQIIGEIGFHGMPNALNEVDLGYLIYDCHQKKGYCYEAVMALIAYVKESHAPVNIVSDCLKYNEASIKILKKCGFEYDYQTKTHYYYRKGLDD